MAKVFAWGRFRCSSAASEIKPRRPPPPNLTLVVALLLALVVVVILAALLPKAKALHLAVTAVPEAVVLAEAPTAFPALCLAVIRLTVAA